MDREHLEKNLEQVKFLIENTTWEYQECMCEYRDLLTKLLIEWKYDKNKSDNDPSDDPIGFPKLWSDEEE